MTITVAGAVENVRTGTSDPWTWSHNAGTTSPQGVVVAITHPVSVTDHVVSVTYGGVALTRPVRTTDGSGELGAAELWWLGSGVPTGTQTVSVDLASGTTDDMHGVSITLDAASDLERISIASASADAANPSLTLSQFGASCMVFAALFSGHDAVGSFTVNGNTTSVHTHDYGTTTSHVLRRTTAGTSDVAIGGTATSEDRAIVGLALAEIQPRYWVGGSATWDGVVGTKWSCVSGGAGGAPVPTSGSDVYIDAASGAVTVTVGSTTRNCNNLDLTGFTGTLAGTVGIDAYGSVTFPSGMTMSWLGTLGMRATSGTVTLTTNGKILDDVTVDANGGTVQLGDDLELITTGTFTFTRGTFSLNNHNLSCRDFVSSAPNTRTLTFGSGIMTLDEEAAAGTAFVLDLNSTGLTVNGGTGKIVISGTPASGTREVDIVGNVEFNNIEITGGSGTSIVQLNFVGTTSVKNLTTTSGFTGTLRVQSAAGSICNIAGNLSLDAALGSLTNPSGDTLTFTSTSGVKTITTGGASIPHAINFDGVGGTWELQDDLTCTGAVTLTNGELDLNGFELSASTFSSNNSNTRTIDFGGGVLATTSTAGSTAFSCATTTGLTVDRTAGGEIDIRGDTTNVRTLAFGSATWPDLKLTNATAAGGWDFTGSPTFSSIIKNFSTAQTLRFTAGTTTTIETSTTGFPSGTAGNVLTVTSITGASHTLAKSGGGTITCDYLGLSWSTATPDATWDAGANSTDSGNNSGWMPWAPISLNLDTIASAAAVFQATVLLVSALQAVPAATAVYEAAERPQVSLQAIAAGSTVHQAAETPVVSLQAIASTAVVYQATALLTSSLQQVPAASQGYQASEVPVVDLDYIVSTSQAFDLERGPPDVLDFISSGSVVYQATAQLSPTLPLVPATSQGFQATEELVSSLQQVAAASTVFQVSAQPEPALSLIGSTAVVYQITETLVSSLSLVAAASEGFQVVEVLVSALDTIAGASVVYQADVQPVLDMVLSTAQVFSATMELVAACDFSGSTAEVYELAIGGIWLSSPDADNAWVKDSAASGGWTKASALDATWEKSTAAPASWNKDSATTSDWS